MPRNRHGADLQDRPSSHSSRTILVVLLTIAFGLRLLVRLPRDESSFLEDGYTFYLDMARTFLDGSGFCWEPAYRCADRMPVYPLLISPFLSSGWMYPGLAIVQAAVGASMVWLAWRLGLELFNARAGLLAAAMAALGPYAVVHDTALQDTVVVNVLIALGVAVLLSAARTSSLGLFVSAGATFALAVLTSARIGFVVPIAVAWTALCAGRSWDKRLRHAGFLVLPIAVLVGGWMVRNWQITGWPVLSTQAGTDLWAANSPWTFAHFPRRSIDLSMVEAMTHLTPRQAVALDSAGSDEVAASRLMALWAVEHMKAHPLETLFGGARKVWVVVSAQLSPARGSLAQTGYTIVYGTLHLLALAGLWQARANWRPQALVLAIVLSFLAMTAVYWAHTSHKSVLDIFLFVYAGAALSHFVARRTDTPSLHSGLYTPAAAPIGPNRTYRGFGWI